MHKVQKTHRNLPRANHNATRTPSWSPFATITLRNDPLAITRRMRIVISQCPPHGFDTQAEQMRQPGEPT